MFHFYKRKRLWGRDLKAFLSAKCIFQQLLEKRGLSFWAFWTFGHSLKSNLLLLPSSSCKCLAMDNSATLTRICCISVHLSYWVKGEKVIKVRCLSDCCVLILDVAKISHFRYCYWSQSQYFVVVSTLELQDALDQTKQHELCHLFAAQVLWPSGHIIYINGQN